MNAGPKRLLPSRIPKEESTNRNYSISRSKVHRLTIVSNQWNTALISCTRALLCINKSARAETSRSCAVTFAAAWRKGSSVQAASWNVSFGHRLRSCFKRLSNVTWEPSCSPYGHTHTGFPQGMFYLCCFLFFFNKNLRSFAKKACLCTFNSVHVTVITFIP